MIPYGRQLIDDSDIQAVENVLRSDWLTQGPIGPCFETAVAQYCQVPYVTAVSNATAALHLACLALGVQAEDWVWTSPNSFVASANCARYCQARVDFVDIDPDTYNLCPKQLERKLERAQIQGQLPKVVIPVHFSGLPCDMQRIYELSQIYGFSIIEDASHAIGARFTNGAPVGSGHYSDITVFSLHPVKIITSAEGGLATTRQPKLHEKLQRLRSHGVTRDEMQMPETEAPPPWYYEQLELGFNYRLTELQAALGLSQLRRLDAFVAKRADLRALYDKKILAKGLPIRTQTNPSGASSAQHLYVVELMDSTVDRLRVFENMRAHGIGVNVHYIPIHTQPYYRRLGFSFGDYPVAETYYQRVLSLPMHCHLSEADIDETLYALERSIEEAEKHTSIRQKVARA